VNNASDTINMTIAKEKEKDKVYSARDDIGSSQIWFIITLKP